MENETNLTFGEKLKQARKSAGLTQEQLAEKLMVSRQAVTKWESDRGLPDIGNIKRIARLLNVSID
ncbi:MAG: helix-turn-helix transcriptional regulator, partial [Acutalibacteraceae bacterium]